MGAGWSMPIMVVCSCQWLQLTLEQHGFELHGSTYMQGFFNSKYCSTIWTTVGWIWACGTTDMEELQLLRNAYMEGQLCRGWALLTPIPPRCSRVNCIQGMGLWWNLATEAFFFFFGCVGSSLLRVGFSLVALWCMGFSLQWLLLLWSRGCRRAGFSSCGTWA